MADTLVIKSRDELSRLLVEIVRLTSNGEESGKEVAELLNADYSNLGREWPESGQVEAHTIPDEGKL